jgi:Polyketide cyclase / dehydrase and lipid transport
MRIITVEKVVAASGADTFAWFADAGNYTRSPFVVRARLVRHGRDAAYGLDAVRELTWVFGWFRERITDYDPPHEFSYLVKRSVPPVRHEGGRLTFTEVPGGTRVRWQTTVEVALPFGADAVTRTMGVPFIAYTFGNVVTTADAALTGQEFS